MADRLAKAMSKTVPTLGHSTSRFNEQFLDKRSVRSEFLTSRAPPARAFLEASGALTDWTHHAQGRWLSSITRAPCRKVVAARHQKDAPAAGACRGFKRHFLWSVLDRRSQSTHAGLQGPYTEARFFLFCGVPSGISLPASLPLNSEAVALGADRAYCLVHLLRLSPGRPTFAAFRSTV